MIKRLGKKKYLLLESDMDGKVHMSNLQNRANGERLIFSNSKISLTVDESTSMRELNMKGRSFREFLCSADVSEYQGSDWKPIFEYVREAIKHFEHCLEEMGYGGAWDDRCLYFGEYKKDRLSPSSQ